MPSAFYAKKKVFICHFGEVCICCANQSFATPHQCCMYQRCPQLRYQRETNPLTRCRLNRKHLYSTITFWKQQQQQRKNEIHRSRKSLKKKV